MKPKSHSRPHLSLIVVGSAAFLAAALFPTPKANAAIIYWDTNGATAGSGAPTGTWGTSAFWSTDATGSVATANITITNPDDVVFSAGTNGTAGTVTINLAQVASSITFDDNVALTLSGGTSITLGGAGTSQGILVASGNNAANTISTALILANTTSTFQTAGTGVLTLSGGITGAQALVLQNNSTNAAGITISTVALNNTGTVTNNGAGTGGVLISSVIGANVTGVIQNSATSALTLFGTNTYTGAGTTITSGIINAASGGSLSTGAVINSGILNLTGVGSTYTFGAVSGAGTTNITLGTSGQSLTFAAGTTWSGLTTGAIINVGVSQAAASGKVQFNSALPGTATVNVTANSTLYSSAGVTHNALLVLNGGTTGETLGQLRLEGNAIWAGQVTLAANTSIGASGSTGTISGNIIETGGSRSLTKFGSGTIVLSGANLYTGGTTLTAGTPLIAQDGLTATPGANNFIKGLGTGTVTLGTGGGTLGLLANGNGSTQTIITGDGTTGNNVAVGGSATINVDRLTANSGSTIRLNNLSIGAQTLTVTGGNSYGLQFAGATTLTGNATFNPTSAPLTLTGAIGDGGSAFGFTKTGSGALNLSTTAANTYTGATTIGTAGSTTSAGTLTVSGAAGSIATSSGVTIHGSGSRLLLDYTGAAGNEAMSRLNDSTANTVALTLGGELSFTGNANAATNTTELMGNLQFGAGSSTTTLTTGGTNVLDVTANSLVRQNLGTGLIRGSNLGSGTSSVANLKLTNVPTTGVNFVGTGVSPTGTSSNVKNLAIVPWLIGDTAAGGSGSGFLTYDLNTNSANPGAGLRVLSTNEQQTTITGAATGENVRSTATETAIATKTINSLFLVPGATQAITGAGGASLTISSGALALGANQTTTVSGFDGLNFGNNEAVITVTGSGILNLNSAVNVTGGGLTKSGGGTLNLGAASNSYTGATTINQGTLSYNNAANQSFAALDGVGAVVNAAGSGTLAFTQAASTTYNIGTITNNTTTGATGAFTLTAGASSNTTIGTITGASGSVVNLGGASTGITNITNLLNTIGQTVNFNAGIVNLNGSGAFRSTMVVNGATVNTVNTTANTFNFNEVVNLQVLSGTLNVQQPSALRIGNQFGTNSASGAVSATALQSGGTMRFTNAATFQLGNNAITGPFTATFALSGGLFDSSAGGGISIGAGTSGGGITSFNFSGGTLLMNGDISGTQGDAARQSFVWTGGTLATRNYIATNLTSAQGSPVSLNVTNTLTNAGGILAPGNVGMGGRTIITGNYSVTSANAFYAVDLGSATIAAAFQSGLAFYDTTTVSGALSVGGKLNVSLINSFTPLAATTFNIFSGASSALGSFTNVNASNNRVNLASGTGSMIFTLGNTSTLTSFGAGSDLIWTGASNVTNGWNVATTPNWTKDGVPSNFNNADFVTFDQTGIANNTINLNTALTAGGVTFSNTSGTYTVTGTGGIGGTGTLTKSGAGTALLAAANTYTGATTVNAGALQLSGANGAVTGASAYTLTGGSLTLDNTTAAGGNNLDRIANTSAIALNGGAFSFRGADAASTNSTETVGAITGTGNSTATIAFGGTNLATLTAASFGRSAGNGAILVNGVNLGQDTASAASVGRFIITTAPTLVGTTAAAATGIASGTVNTRIVPFLLGEATSTTGGFGTASGTANTFLSYHATTGLRPLNPTDEFTQNAITVGSNTRITSATTASASAAINSLIIAGGNLTIADTQTLTNTSGALLFTSTNAVTPSTTTGILAFGTAEAMVTVNAGITGTISARISGSAGLTKNGTGTLTLSGANTYTSTTTINSGILNAGFAESAGVSGPFGTQAASAAGTIVFRGGTLQYSTANQNDYSGRFSTAASQPISIDTNSQTVTFATALAGSGTTLTKTGAGTLTLSNTTNTYTGLTTVSGSTLSLAAANSNNISSSSGISIGNGATLNVTSLSGSVLILTQGQTITGTGATGFIANGAGGADSVRTTGNNIISNNASGTLTLARLNVLGAGNAITGGTITLNNALAGRGLLIGNGAPGTLTLSGGTLNSASITGTDLIGNNSTASFIINGGIYNNTSTGGVALGNGNGTPTLTLTSGTATMLRLDFSGGAGIGATVNLDGGTLSVTAINQNGNPGTFNFNGGTLKAGATSATYWNSAATMTANVRAGGARIDDGGNAITIGQALIHEAALGATVDGGLIKTGAGTLTLSGANTYTGITTVSAGSLIVANNTALGTTAGGTTVTAGAALVLANTITVTGETATIAGGGNGNSIGALYSQSGASATWAGTVDLGTGGSSRLGADGGILTVSGPIIGNGSILQISSDLTAATGVVILSGTSNTYSGGTQIVRGTLKLGATNALPTATTLDVHFSPNTGNPATFDLNGNNQTVAALQNTGGTNATVTVTNSSATPGTLTVNGSASTTYSGVIAGGSTLALAKNGTGTLSLTGINTYTGATTINGGTLTASGGSAIADTSAVVLANTAGAIFNPTTSETIGSLAGGGAAGGNVTLGATILTAGGDNTTTTFAGALSGTGGALVKSGTGTLSLTGNNTYTGSTSVNAGKLVIGGSVTSNMTIASGATVGGSGTITGNLSLSAESSGGAGNGGTLAAGNSPGILTVSGTTNFNTGSIFAWDLDLSQVSPETNRGIAYDGVNTSGVTGSGGIFQVVLQGSQGFGDIFWSSARTWSNIFTTDGTNPVTSNLASVFSSFSYANGSGVLANPSAIGSFTLSGSQLSWSAVPEPTSALAGLLLGAGLLRRRRTAGNKVSPKDIPWS